MTDTYERGADLFWAKQDPFTPPNGKGDVFKYSPLFAGVYGAFGFLPGSFQALAWALFNAFVFWAGISSWFQFKKGAGWFFWLCWIAVSMELDISLRYQQKNALITGLILLGLSEYRNLRFRRAALWLAVGTNFKVFPALFLAALVAPWRKQYALPALLGSLTLLLLPFTFLGFSSFIPLHFSWANLLLTDIRSPGLLDVASVLKWWGVGTAGEWLRRSILVASFCLILVSRKKSSLQSGWAGLYCVVAGCILLCSPRTESPTFILIAPPYLFLLPKASRTLTGKIFLGFVLFLITVCFTDLWPKVLWNPGDLKYSTKVLGTFLIWLWGSALVLKAGPREKSRA